MRYRLWRDGAAIDLSRERKLGEGGEARVFCVASLGMAAKIYHHPGPTHLDKLMVMLQNPPLDPSSAQGHVAIAWPSDLLLHPDGSFCGYVMPLVERMEPLVNFYVPKLRRQSRPLFDYYYLVTGALNVATAVRALHDRDYVIGDVNESNILLSDRALATVVDTDSFQVFDPATATIYRSPVGKPEFTPPELHGMDFARVDRTRAHDCFGLTVTLFQLLMEGTHPFDGVYARPGEPPPVDERIAAGHFPHGDAAVRGPYRPKPIAPPFGMLDPALQRLFVQCFVESHSRPSARPDAAAWRAALAQAASNLRTCTVNDRHRYWGHVACPWCERAQRLRGIDPFPSLLAVKQGQHLLQRSIGAPTPPSRSRPPMSIPVRSAPRPAQRSVPRPGHRFLQRPGQRMVQLPRRHPASWHAPRGRRSLVWLGVIFAVIVQWIVTSLNQSGGPSGKIPSVLDALPRMPSNPDHADRSSDPLTAIPSLHVDPSSHALAFPDISEKGRSFRGSVGLKMVWIPSETFLMGDGTGNGDLDERPLHEVRLQAGYWLGETEVTQQQWKAVMETNPSSFRGDNLPVESVDWNEAAAFARKLTEREHASGNLPAGIEYRLPTEAQWEFACRAGIRADYAGDLDVMAWYSKNSAGITHDVKTKNPNAWGLYDMQGNVREWCADWYGSYPPGRQIDPRGPSAGTARVDRGGSWNSSAANCRFPHRGWTKPDSRDSALGFRLAAVFSDETGVTEGTKDAAGRPEVKAASEGPQWSTPNHRSVNLGFRLAAVPSGGTPAISSP